MRTTVDIDARILKELKRLQKREGKSLGRLVSDLLAQALAIANTSAVEPVAFVWCTRTMGARIDLADKQALLDTMDDPSR